MKTQNEYLEELENELRYLKAKEINEIIKHYRDKINQGLDYGEKESKIIENLPTPHDVAKNIYESKGISYLEIQRHKYHQKQIFTAIYSSILILLLAILFIGITGYILLITFNMNILIPNSFAFTKILDTILTTLFVILYDVVIIMALIYLFDLFYLLITYFLVNVLKAFKKNEQKIFHFTDFTLSGTISQKAKVKKLPISILLCGVIAMFVFGITSFFSKGYIYRTLMDAPALTETIEYEQNIKDITINGDNANVYLVIDESLSKVTIEYRYEFKNTFKTDLDEASLNIQKENKKTYDIFGLLDEPSLVIYIKLPTKEYLKNINIKLDEGIVSYKNLDMIALNSDIDVYNATILLENVSMQTLNITTFKGNIKIANTSEDQTYWINQLTTSIEMGTFGLEGYRNDSFKLTNSRAEISINKLRADSIDLNNTTGSISMSNINGDTFKLTSGASINYFSDIYYKEIDLNLLSTCSINITRIDASKSLTANIKNDSYLTLYNANSPNMKIDNNKGTFIMKGIEDSTLTIDPSNTVVEITSDNGDTLINSTKLKSLTINQKGKQIDLSDLELTDLKVVATNTKSIELSEVYGTNVHFTLNNSPLKYYNESETNKFTIKYEGVSQIYTNKEYIVE